MAIKRQLGFLCKLAGIEKSTHGFRHFYITALLKKLEVRDVRKFSRHSSLEMLIVYDDEIDIKKKTVDVFQVFEKFNVV
jgi:integrase